MTRRCRGWQDLVRRRLRESPVPVKLFNAYDRCENETLDAAWLILKLIPKLYQVDWESLPVERDPAEVNRWRSSMSGYGYGSGHWLCDWDDPDPSMFDCETCGERMHHSSLHEVEMADGYVYLMCRDCRSYFKAQGYSFGDEEPVDTPDEDARQMELAV